MHFIKWAPHLKPFISHIVAIRFHSSWIVVFPLAILSFTQSVTRAISHSNMNEMVIWGFCGAFFFLFSLFIHEIGHILISMYLKFPPYVRILFPFGSIQSNQLANKLTHLHIYVVLAGPIASCISAICWYILFIAAPVLSIPSPLIVIIHYQIMLNYVLAAINLLPFFPLDCGTILCYLISKINTIRFRYSTVIPIMGTVVTICFFLSGCYLLCTGYFSDGLWWIIGSILYGSALIITDQNRYFLENMYGEKVSKYMRKNPITLPPSLPIDRFMTDYYYRYNEGIYPVIQYSAVQGVLTTHIIQRIPKEQWHNCTVGEICEEINDSNSVPINEDMIVLSKKLMVHPDHKLLVVKGDQLCGIITLYELLPFFNLKLGLTSDNYDSQIAVYKKRSEPEKVTSFQVDQK